MEDIKDIYKENYDLMCKAHDNDMNLKIEEEAYLTNITLDRFKNDCVSILRYKYKVSYTDATEEINALENKDYLDYITYEDNTEDYIDELVSCWGIKC